MRGVFPPRKGGRGVRAAAPRSPARRRSRALAAVIPCSGLKIAPGAAAAAHRHSETVINNPGGRIAAAPRRSGPSRLLREEVGALVPAVMLEGWMDGWRRAGEGGLAARAPWPGGETEA